MMMNSKQHAHGLGHMTIKKCTDWLWIINILVLHRSRDFNVGSDWLWIITHDAPLLITYANELKSAADWLIHTLCYPWCTANLCKWGTVMTSREYHYDVIGFPPKCSIFPRSIPTQFVGNSCNISECSTFSSVVFRFEQHLPKQSSSNVLNMLIIFIGTWK